MSTLADDFLNDLLDDGEELPPQPAPKKEVKKEKEKKQQQPSNANNNNNNNNNNGNNMKVEVKKESNNGSMEVEMKQEDEDDLMGDGNSEDDDESGDEEDDEEEEDISNQSLESILKVYGSNRLSDMVKRIEYALKQGNSRLGTIQTPIEEDDEYGLIVDANLLTADIGEEMFRIHRFLKDLYKFKFPELDTIVLNPLEYAKTIQRIGNAPDITEVDLNDILPSHQVMVVTVQASTIQSKSLTSAQQSDLDAACKALFTLDEKRRKSMEYVESRMSLVAPNLTAMVGASVAAKMMGSVGGLVKLSKLTSNAVAQLGNQKRTLSGFSTVTIRRDRTFLWDAEIVTRAPAALRNRVVRQLGGKVALVARVDAFREDQTAQVGIKFREEIQRKIDKALEPPPLKEKKALPVPFEGVKKSKRGGRRARKQKQKFEVTELRKQMNRVQFGAEAQEEFRDTAKTLGMLGKQTGKVRLTTQEKNILKKARPSGTTTTQSSGATSGLSSSLAFTPIQGIELSNPALLKQQQLKNQSKYFSLNSFAQTPTSTTTTAPPKTT